MIETVFDGGEHGAIFSMPTGNGVYHVTLEKVFGKWEGNNPYEAMMKPELKAKEYMRRIVSVRNFTLLFCMRNRLFVEMIFT